MQESNYLTQTKQELRKRGCKDRKHPENKQQIVVAILISGKIAKKNCYRQERHFIMITWSTQQEDILKTYMDLTIES